MQERHISTLIKIPLQMFRYFKLLILVVFHLYGSGEYLFIISSASFLLNMDVRAVFNFLLCSWYIAYIIGKKNETSFLGILCWSRKTIKSSIVLCLRFHRREILNVYECIKHKAIGGVFWKIKACMMFRNLQSRKMHGIFYILTLSSMRIWEHYGKLFSCDAASQSLD